MSKLSCSIVRELLPLYVDGVLEQEVKEELEQHFKECEECTLLLENMQKEQDIIITKDKKSVNYLKKHRRRMLKVIGIVFLSFLLIVGAIAIFLHELIIGDTITYKNIEDYEGVSVYGSAVFPDKDTECISGEYYYEKNDLIFSPKFQIYLKMEYTKEQYEKEIERLENWELRYYERPFKLYIDDENYMNRAYVATANWGDCFQYAITIDNLNTVVYVYLRNMNLDELHMDDVFLPSYFEEDNSDVYQDAEVSEKHMDVNSTDYVNWY